jgi:hypothetical protein
MTILTTQPVNDDENMLIHFNLTSTLTAGVLVGGTGGAGCCLRMAISWCKTSNCA